MDNASFYKNIRTRDIIEKEGHTFIYLPPYPPDYNSIEVI